MEIFVGSERGGKGKTCGAAFMLNHFISCGEKPILMDGSAWRRDPIMFEPDISKTYKDSAECHPVDLRAKAGWASLLDVAFAAEGRPVVVDMDCGMDEAVLDYWRTALNVLPDALVLWMVGTEEPGVELLDKVLAPEPRPLACIVKNGRFGGDGEFSAFEEPRFAGIPSVYLPRIDDMIVKRLFDDNLPIHKLKEEMTRGQWVYAEPELKKATACFEEVFKVAAKLA